MILILFGVSGAGKTTIGNLLSTRLGWCFEDGDHCHSVANRRKMESGTQLTDEELRAVAQCRAYAHARVHKLNRKCRIGR
jgi:gluconate kinase